MAFLIAQLGGFFHIWAKMSMHKSWVFLIWSTGGI